MHEWVVSTKNDLDKFKMEFEDYFDLHYCLIYYVYTFVALMVDQRAKNMFLTYWGETGKWQPWFYDNDTSFGINNEGQLVLDYYHEDTDQLGNANVYNGQNSVLWTNFREAYADEIKETYQNLRNNGLITYDKLVDRFITNGSDKWSESIYNEDSDFKYISMLRSDNDATNLPQVRGSGEEHFRYFVENRLNYCDSKWYASDYANDYISLRIYTPTTWAGVEPNPRITVTPFSDMYAGVRYKANGTLYQERATHGVPVSFSPQGETFESENNETFNDTETAVYGAHQLSSIGDLAPLYCGSVNVANADKLVELKVGDATAGYSNANLHELSVGTNKLLKKIDVQNCPNFASVLDLSNCSSIEEVYAKGSSITGVNFPESGMLRIAQLPATITNFTLKHQLYVESLTFQGYDSIKTLWVENCPNVDGFDILSKAKNIDRLRITNVNLQYDTASEMLALAARPIGGIDENGTNIDKMWIDGTCHIKSLTGAEYLEVKEAFPYLTITYDVLTSYLTFMSEDGNTQLGRVAVNNGGDGTYSGTTPTKASTAQYDYTFAGWSKTPGGSVDSDALKNVEADRTVYAAFSSTLRSYTVRFYNGTTLLQTSTVKYGGTATYTGSTPVNNSTGNPDDFEFYGWSPSPANIQGNTDCYAQFHDMREITDDWATVAANVANGTAVDKYAVGAFKTLNIGEKELPYEFNQGSAVLYNNEIHILGSVISEYRTSHYKWDRTEWVEVGVIPYEFYYGSAVVYNNEIHILGGSSSSSGRTKHYKWDGSNWTFVSTLPYIFEKGVAIVYDNEIHIMGSNNSSHYTSHYKWNGSAWSEVGNLPYSFYTASGFIYNNEIHVLGSYDSNYETAHYKYDGSSWTSVSTLPQKLSNGHALVVGTDIYMIQWDEFYKYDGVSWHACPEVPANVYDGRSVVLDDDIYVMGSSVSENGRVFYSYAPETSTWSKVGITESIPMQIVAHNHDELPDGVGKWETLGGLSRNLYYGVTLTLNNEIYLVGGKFASHLDKWNGTEWTRVSTLPCTFYEGSALVYNNEIHIIGSGDSSYRTSHYKWDGTEWVSVSTLPYAFRSGMAVVYNDCIHIISSRVGSDTQYLHYKWDGTEWVSVRMLPYAAHRGSAVVYNNEIHILGGYSSSCQKYHYKWNGTEWVSVSTLPYSFYDSVAIVHNNEIHIIGSGDSSYTTSHYKWNGTEWVSVSTLPYDFYQGGAVVYDGKIYILGSAASSYYYKNFFQLVGAETKWESLGDIPHYFTYGSAVVYNNEIHILGSSSSPYKQHYKWDGSAWISVSTLPYGFYYGSAVVYNNEIHIIGGGTSANNVSHYKWNGSTWTSVSTLPYSFSQSSAVVYNNEIHILGGNGGNTKHYKWNGTEWTSASTLPYNFYNGSAVVYNDEIHILGSISGAYHKHHYKWNGSAWASVSTLPYDFYNGSAVVYNNEIHILGGSVGTYNHYKWDGSAWTSVSTLSCKFNNGSVIVYSNNIYILGSESQSYNKSFYTLTTVKPKATLTFVAGSLLKDAMQWTNANNANGGYSKATIRSYLNDTLTLMFPSDLQTALTEVIKISDGGDSRVLKTTSDKVWLLSLDELGLSDSKLVSGQGVAYSVFTDNASRIRTLADGTTETYFTRSTRDYKSVYTIVRTGGNSYCSYSSSYKPSDYVLIGFCL